MGGATLIGAFYAGGGMLLAYTAPIWVLAAALTWIPISGRPTVEWLPIACWWLWRTTGGQLLYRRRIVVPAPRRYPSPCPVHGATARVHRPRHRRR